MCWSKEVSLLTFLVGTSSSFLLTQFKQPMMKIYGFFFMFVSLMQGIEFLLWSHQTCDTIHKQISIAGMFLTLLQPFVLGIITLFFNGGQAFLSIGLLCVGYLIGIAPFIKVYLQTEQLQCTVQKCNDPHLIWNWAQLPNMTLAHSLYLGAFCLIALLGFPDRSSAILFSMATILSYTLSLYKYKRAVFGSMWCWYVALCPPFLLAFHTMR